jgi:hypothetical protein
MARLVWSLFMLFSLFTPPIQFVAMHPRPPITLAALFFFFFFAAIPTKLYMQSPVCHLDLYVPKEKLVPGGLKSLSTSGAGMVESLCYRVYR